MHDKCSPLQFDLFKTGEILGLQEAKAQRPHAANMLHESDNIFLL